MDASSPKTPSTQLERLTFTTSSTKKRQGQAEVSEDTGAETPTRASKAKRAKVNKGRKNKKAKEEEKAKGINKAKGTKQAGSDTSDDFIPEDEESEEEE